MFRLRAAEHYKSQMSQLFGKRKQEGVEEASTFLRQFEVSVARNKRQTGKSGASGQETTPPVKPDARWWLQVCVGVYRLRALYDPGTSQTVMGPSGIQLASACRRELTPSYGREARMADGP